MPADEGVSSPWRNASTGLVAYCVVLSLVSNSVFGRSIGDVSRSYEQRFSPSGSAFIIWLPIYALSGWLIFEQLRTGRLEAGREKEEQILILQNAFYSISWLCAAGWTPAFTTGTAAGIVTAAILLSLTALFALAAVFSGFFDTRWSWASWVTAAAYSLLAGWTVVAAAINVAIAYQASYGKPNTSFSTERNDDYNIFSTIEAKYQTAVPLILASIFAVVVAGLSQPVLGVPIAWAIYFMRPSYYNYAAFAVITVGVLAATARTLHAATSR